MRRTLWHDEEILARILLKGVQAGKGGMTGLASLGREDTTTELSATH